MPTHYQGHTQDQQALDVYIKLMRAAAAVETRVNQHLATHGLTISQFGVLETLYHLGSLCQKDIAAKILKSTGNLTIVIDNLEKRGLVLRQRNTDDRRRVDVYLTPDGHALIEAIFPTHVAMVSADVGILTDAEQLEFQRLCKKLGLQAG